jgi:hypothetical protein
MEICRIYVKFNPDKKHEVTKPTEDILLYLKNAIDNLNKHGIAIYISKVAGSDMKKLLDKGVTKLPALKSNHKYICGVSDIVNYLSNLVRRKPKTTKTNWDEDSVKNYQEDILYEGGDDQDNNEGKTLQNKMNSYMKMRADRNKTHGKEKIKDVGDFLKMKKKKKKVVISEPEDSDDEDGNVYTAPTNNTNPVNILQGMAKASGSQDDDLLAQYYAGRELSS